MASEATGCLNPPAGLVIQTHCNVQIEASHTTPWQPFGAAQVGIQGTMADMYVYIYITNPVLKNYLN